MTCAIMDSTICHQIHWSVNECFNESDKTRGNFCAKELTSRICLKSWILNIPFIEHLMPGMNLDTLQKKCLLSVLLNIKHQRLIFKERLGTKGRSASSLQSVNEHLLAIFLFIWKLPKAITSISLSRFVLNKAQRTLSWAECKIQPDTVLWAVLCRIIILSNQICDKAEANSMARHSPPNSLVLGLYVIVWY